MAVTIKFTDYQLGGDVTLLSTARGLMSYAPVTPNANDTLVTETIRLIFDSGLQAAVTGDGILRDLARHFLSARNRQNNRAGLRIYIEYNPGIGDNVRSEVLDGRIVFPPDIIGPAHLQSDRGEVTIIFQRRPYWEDITESELPLYDTATTTFITGGIEIHNSDDATKNNFVTWEAGGIGGDLPAALRITLENDDISLEQRRIHMALSQDIDPANGLRDNWTLEGEDNTYNPGTVTINAISSGGDYMEESWTATTETQVFMWTLSNTDIARGLPFRVMARFVNNAYDNLYARIVVYGGSGDGEVWRSKLIRVGYEDGAGVELSDMGTIRLPPGYPEGLTPSSVKIALNFLRAQSGTHTVRLDYLMFMPMDGGYRVIEASAAENTLDNSAFLVDDGILEQTYRLTSLGVGTFQWSHTGDYLKAQPYKEGRISFLWADDTTAPATWQSTVRVYYRERRVSL